MDGKLRHSLGAYALLCSAKSYIHALAAGAEGGSRATCERKRLSYASPWNVQSTGMCKLVCL